MTELLITYNVVNLILTILIIKSKWKNSTIPHLIGLILACMSIGCLIALFAVLVKIWNNIIESESHDNRI